MSKLSELAMRILSELYEAGEEDVPSMINPSSNPTGSWVNSLSIRRRSKSWFEPGSPECQPTATQRVDFGIDG